jgi:hypothetical protein
VEESPSRHQVACPITRANRRCPRPNYDYGAPQFVDRNSHSDLDFKDALQSRDILSTAMNENPHPRTRFLCC